VCYVQSAGDQQPISHCSADMDGNRRGSGDDQAGPNGPNVTQNPFDSAALLGKDMMLFLIQLSFHLNDFRQITFVLFVFI